MKTEKDFEKEWKNLFICFVGCWCSFGFIVLFSLFYFTIEMLSIIIFLGVATVLISGLIIGNRIRRDLLIRIKKR